MIPMYYTMRKAYYCPSMITDIHTTITKCTTCAQNRLALRRHTTPLTLFPATQPLTELSVDNVGPIPASKKGNRFILAITDRFAKLTKCVALRRITAMSVRGVSHHRRVGVRLRAPGPDPIGPRAPVHVELLHRCDENAWH